MSARCHNAPVLGSALALLWGGCVLHEPALEPPPLVSVQSRFQEAAPHLPEPRGMLPPQPWWDSFEHRPLTELIETALENNLNLEQLAARVDQAAALLRQAGARLFPSLDASGNYDSRWTLADGSGSRQPDQSSSLGVLLNWELDLWGRLRSVQQARRFGVRASAHDWLGGRLLLSASVAETYFEWMEQREQLRLAREQIEINRTLLELTQLRFGQGLASIVDVLQQQEQLASTQARLPDIQARLHQLGYSIDVLLGRTPRDRIPLDQAGWVTPPPLPDVGLPSELLDHRPDLRAARDRLVALDHEVAEAVAERLPRFSLGGSLAAAGDPSFSSMAANAFASAAGPILDAGLRRSEVRLRRARVRESLAAFSQTYLAAVAEVETALLRERSQRERVQLIEGQLAIAQRLLVETRNRYSQGLTDYLPVLNAVATEQDLQRDLLEGRRLLLTFRVALHRALGGPMDPVPLPRPALTGQAGTAGFHLATQPFSPDTP